MCHVIAWMYSGKRLVIWSAANSSSNHVDLFKFTWFWSSCSWASTGTDVLRISHSLIKTPLASFIIQHFKILFSIPTSSSPPPVLSSHLSYTTPSTPPFTPFRWGKGSQENQQSMAYQVREDQASPHVARRLNKSPHHRERVPKSQLMHQGQVLVLLLGAPKRPS